MPSEPFGLMVAGFIQRLYRESTERKCAEKVKRLI